MGGMADQIKSMLGIITSDSKDSQEEIETDEIIETEENEEIETDEEITNDANDDASDDSDKKFSAELSDLEKAQAQIAALTAKLEEVTKQGNVQSQALSTEDDVLNVEFFENVDWTEVSRDPDKLQSVMQDAFGKLSKELRAAARKDASAIAQQEATQITSVREYAQDFFSNQYPELANMKTYVVNLAGQLGKDNEGMKLTEAMTKAAEKTMKDLGLDKIDLTETKSNSKSSLRTPRSQKKEALKEPKLNGTESQIASMLKEIKNI